MTHEAGFRSAGSLSSMPRSRTDFAVRRRRTGRTRSRLCSQPPWDARRTCAGATGRYTGASKHPVDGPRLVRRLNIDGDGQGDLQGHGGEQRATRRAAHLPGTSSRHSPTPTASSRPT